MDILCCPGEGGRGVFRQIPSRLQFPLIKSFRSWPISRLLQRRKARFACTKSKEKNYPKDGFLTRTAGPVRSLPIFTGRRWEASCHLEEKPDTGAMPFLFLSKSWGRRWQAKTLLSIGLETTWPLLPSTCQHFSRKKNFTGLWIG